MRILIIGASGFIGNRVYNHLLYNVNFEMIGTYYRNDANQKLTYLDITKEEQIYNILSDFKPDIVLWIAGTKNLKFCEENLENAKKINTYPIEQYINCSKKIGLKEHLIFFSTDYVFDGKKGNYLDSSKANPNTNYGISNFLAEEMIAKSGIKNTIIRTSAVMGKGGTFFDWAIESLKKDTYLELFSNIYFSPTPIDFLILNIIFIIKQRKYGIFNISGNIKFSRYDFVNLLKTFDKNFIANLLPIESQIQYLQHDLSLKQSLKLLKIPYDDFVSFLKKEI